MDKTLLRPFVVLVLTCVFAYLISVSIRKYYARQIGVVTSEETTTEIEYPTVTVCGYLSSPTTNVSVNMISGKHGLMLDGMKAEVNLTEEAQNKGNFGWSRQIVNENLCNSYTPLKPSPIGMAHALKFNIKTENYKWSSDLMSLFIFNTKTMVGGGSSNIFGSSTYDVSMPFKDVFGDTVVEMRFTVDVNERRHLDREERPCTTEGADALRLSECLYQYLGSKQGCSYFSLYGVPNLAGQDSLPPCQESDTVNFFKFYNEVLPSMSEEMFIAETGCKPICNIRSYTLSPPSIVYKKAGNGSDADSRLELTIAINKPSITIEDEVYIYDGNNLWADIGGFVGMLLGASCLYIWDQMVEVLCWIHSKANGKKKVQNRK